MARDVWYSSADGLKLYARDEGLEAGDATPVLCLPGLTRNSKDFEKTLSWLLAGKRRVVSADFRGRGRSEYASNPLTYRPDVEMADTLALMDHLGIARAAIIGTSRGGIVAMLMAAQAKDRLAGICLNDIGPKIETAGLLRIRSYLGADPKFASWEDAVKALKSTNPGFESLSNAQWLIFAKRVFAEKDGVPRADYDARLTATFPSAEDISAGKVPELWGLYDLIAPLPLLILRGAKSDLLSVETVAEMQRHNPQAQAVEVADRGHVPFLDEPEAVAAIQTWLAQVDQT
ncbi:alpha/beta fold hydrolase [Aestuariivirga sp.]|uniref:alpha/beta fold hydrolase n=1 Tax=Aestuariivirga sp. TaxID=2650926 RepID=UPI0039E4DBE7